MSGAFIELAQVTHRYGEQVVALQDVSLRIERGEFIALVGQNGSGKSTMARLFNALLIPTEGDVRINGQNTRDPQQVWEIRRRIGMVFQNPDNQLIGVTVAEDVAFGPENLGVPSAEIRQRVTEALKRVGMTGFEHRSPHELSGGQKQRVAIAGALAMHSECLILDEPTAMLDPLGRHEVLTVLEELNATGVTVVLVTHHMEEAARAKRVVVMRQGRVVMDGPPSSILLDPEPLHQAYLELPPVTALASMLVRGGLSIGEGIFDVGVLINRIAEMWTGPRFVEDELPHQLEQSGGTCWIKAEGLGYTYPGEGAAALTGVNIEIGANQVIALIGHTGSGKSTLMQHFNALLRPTEGTLTVFGKNVSGPKSQLKDIRRQVGLVFQYPEHQLFEETVTADVSFGPLNNGVPLEEITQRVTSALAAVGLDPEIKERSPFGLSGGQMRRVAIAGVLAMKPQILVLDEPAAGLDPRGRSELLSRLMRQRVEDGRTIILVSHWMEDVAQYADRVIVISEGELVADGSTREVLSDATHLEQYSLACPIGAQVWHGLAARGIQFPIPGLRIEDVAQAILQYGGLGDEIRD